MGATLEPLGTLRKLAREGFSSEARKEIDADDQMALTMEVKDAVFEGGKYAAAKLYRVRATNSNSDPVAFPSLLSGRANLSLSRTEAVEELTIILDIEDANQDSEVLIYSLQIVEPTRWAWPSGGTSLESLHCSNSGRQAELQNGYFYHETLRTVPSDSRQEFLSWLLRSVDTFDVSIRRSAFSPTSRVRVSLEDA